MNEKMNEVLTSLTKMLDFLIVQAETQRDTGNKAAGVRARKASLAAAKLMKDFRAASVAAAKD